MSEVRSQAQAGFETRHGGALTAAAMAHRLATLHDTANAKVFDSVIVVTDRNAYRPVKTSLLLIDEIRRTHLDKFAWTATIDRLTGSGKVKKAIESGTLPALLEEWDREAAAFKASSAKYHLYR